MTIARSTITGNLAPHGGGGLFVFGGTVTIRQSTLAGNGGDGTAAFLNEGGTVVITDSAIVDNVTQAAGSDGLSNFSLPGSVGVLVLTSTTIARNRVVNALGSNGAALTNHSGTQGAPLEITINNVVTAPR